MLYVFPFVSLMTFPHLTTSNFALKGCDHNNDDTVDRMNKISSDNCMLACSDDSAEICGGDSSIVIYVAP
jgi:hypothetical protein